MVIASVQQLTKIYGLPEGAIRVQALCGIDIDFVKGESVAIRGQSGSGKSTLLNLLGCLDRPTSGRYLLGDVDVARLDDDQRSDIRGRQIGFVFQNFNLIPQLTLAENLEVPLLYQGCPPRTRREKVSRLVELVGLGDRSHHRPTELSGGQQQRAAIARSLVNDPVIILADEPTGNLDTATGRMILDIFDMLHDQGRTVVMVTHDTEVSRRCDRLITLRDGLVVEDVRNGR